ncbi:MAG TPA: 16S rRNA (cytidine(1402)-2'-O)-methyltransferase [Porphyromonadaceae bacterium]|nr:16S rRNA (cytidine(1402)-2'-O)-methyltransferase [Porphyromonadaceae bacterium]
MGQLFLVPTPIGNLEDITLRALRVLKEVDAVLAEDTRTSGQLLKHFDIATKLISHHKFNEHQKVEQVVERIKSGETFALISDAGTPSISDPGFLLVRECVNSGVEVICLPGATALIPAVAISGFSTDKFCFEGFLPRKKVKSILQSLTKEHRTMIFYESPFRLVKTLSLFMEYFGEEREVSISREISKIHEETQRGTLKEVISYYTEKPPKGEIVICLAGASKNKGEEEDTDPEEIE